MSASQEPARSRAPSGPPDAPQAPRAPAAPSTSGGADRRDQGGNRARLRRALSSPGATQQAFLLREVLGPPVSLRDGRDDRPS